MNLLCPSRVRDERTADGALLWRAPAKINITLHILGQREDGYHELDSVVAKVTLYDELLFRPRQDGEIRLTCSGYDCGGAEDNLVFRAAKLLSKNQAGVNIELTKRIPAGAGLGGGSSDAAATLMALNRFWKLNLTDEHLTDLAASLGSDVPLFLSAPAVRMTGRGEIIEPVKVHPFGAILYLPDLHCPTAKVYSVYDADKNPQSGFAKRLRRDKSAIRPGTAGVPWPDGNPQLNEIPSHWRDKVFNGLESAAMKVCPALVEISSSLADETHLPVHITGSGSAMFIICDDANEAESAIANLPGEMKNHCRVVSLNPW